MTLRLIQGGLSSSARPASRDRAAERHIAHLRLLAHQLPLWSPETAQRVLRDAVARYESEIDRTPKRAA